MMNKTQLINKLELMQIDIDKELKVNLFKIDLQTVNDEIVNLYKNINNIKKEEEFNRSEIQTLIYNLKHNSHNNMWLYYILLLIGNLGYNKQSILLFVGLYDILSNYVILTLDRFNLYFQWICNYVYVEDIFHKDIMLSNKEIRDILNYRIKNTHYSTRIWNNTELLNDRLFDTLKYGLQNDLPIETMVDEIDKAMNVGLHSVMRLVITEANAVYNLSLLSYYRKVGIKQVQHISTLDYRTSEICRERHLIIIDVTSAIIGENIPPLHPYCRSIIIPIINEPTGVKWYRKED